MYYVLSWRPRYHHKGLDLVTVVKKPGRGKDGENFYTITLHRSSTAPLRDHQLPPSLVAPTASTSTLLYSPSHSAFPSSQQPQPDEALL